MEKRQFHYFSSRHHFDQVLLLPKVGGGCRFSSKNAKPENEVNLEVIGYDWSLESIVIWFFLVQ